MQTDREPTAEELEEHGRRTIGVIQALNAQSEHIEAIYGVFIDSLSGLGLLRERIESAVTQTVRSGRTMEAVLRSPFTHGKGGPETGTALHRSTVAERIDACTTGGFNEIVLGNLCLVAIYSHWEVHTRVAIADALSVRAVDVQAPVFGDLRHMRHCILHVGGVMDERARHLEVLKWFAKGERIVFTRERFYELIQRLRGFPDANGGIKTPTYNPFPSLDKAAKP